MTYSSEAKRVKAPAYNAGDPCLIPGLGRYDLNQIPYDYTVEVRNRFKGLDRIDRVPDELRKEVRNTVQETGIKTIPMEKKCKKQNGCLRRLYKYLRNEEK